ALHARIDQAGAELRQVEDADDEHHEAGDVQEGDASRQARRTLDRQELPAPAQHAEPALDQLKHRVARGAGGRVVAYARRGAEPRGPESSGSRSGGWVEHLDLT